MFEKYEKRAEELLILKEYNFQLWKKFFDMENYDACEELRNDSERLNKEYDKNSEEWNLAIKEYAKR